MAAGEAGRGDRLLLRGSTPGGQEVVAASERKRAKQVCQPDSPLGKEAKKGPRTQELDRALSKEKEATQEKSRGATRPGSSPHIPARRESAAAE